MKKQELIEKVKEIGIYGLNIFGTVVEGIPTKTAIELIKQLDEPEAGHADEAPRYVKNILARLRELPLHNREVWLKAIMGEFEQDFSRAKWREGYEQGKFEGAMIPYDEPQKVTIPQCVHKYIQEAKEYNWDLQDLMKSIDYEDSEELQRWFYHECNQETLARAWIFGYEVEKEKRYLVKVKGVNEECECLFFGELSNTWKFRSLGSFGELKKHHTRKELEEAGFGWVFDCPGVQIEEVAD
jgi:phage protein|uniref:Phage protein n=2 Tax=unclassified Caudoviricetes TaxID=2788787 RepID=A0A8S5QJ89_9CAUD|nr:MAG TPA: Protein of unknown function (DUF1642) [Siphoviridae sp. ctL053]DAE18865.1 MAG TPA: Protein of unknown function (DUF1642) [Siphoviridae sp. ctNPp8]